MKAIGKYSVWIYGSVMGSVGWIEGKVLEVGEGFKDKVEAEKWARSAMKRLDVPGKSATSHYGVGPAY